MCATVLVDAAPDESPGASAQIIVENIWQRIVNDKWVVGIEVVNTGTRYWSLKVLDSRISVYPSIRLSRRVGRGGRGCEGCERTYPPALKVHLERIYWTKKMCEIIKKGKGEPLLCDFLLHLAFHSLENILEAE